MKTISILLFFFLGIGVFFRSYNRWTRFVLIAGIVAVLLYMYIA